MGFYSHLKYFISSLTDLNSYLKKAINKLKDSISYLMDLKGKQIPLRAFGDLLST